jgi:hypothetical protein
MRSASSICARRARPDPGRGPSSRRAGEAERGLLVAGLLVEDGAEVLGGLGPERRASPGRSSRSPGGAGCAPRGSRRCRRGARGARAAPCVCRLGVELAQRIRRVACRRLVLEDLLVEARWRVSLRACRFRRPSAAGGAACLTLSASTRELDAANEEGVDLLEIASAASRTRVSSAEGPGVAVVRCDHLAEDGLDEPCR